MYTTMRGAVARAAGWLVLFGLSAGVTVGAPLRLAMTVLAESPATDSHGPTIDAGAAEIEQVLASDDLSPLFARAASAGIGLVLVQPSGTMDEVALADGPVAEASEALQAAAAAGVNVILGPMSLGTPSAGDRPAYGPLAAFVHEMERVAGDQPSYAGVAVVLPTLPTVADGSPPEQVQDALSAWLRATAAGLAPVADDLARAGRRLHVVAENAAALSLVVEAMASPVVPLAGVMLDREPTLGYPMGLALAGGLPMGFGVMLRTAAPTEIQLSRALCLASLRGAEIVSLGDARVLLGRTLGETGLLGTAKSLTRFLDHVGRHNLNRDIALLMDREAMAHELLAPRGKGPGETPAALAAAMLLNAGGFPWHVILQARDLADSGAQVALIPSGAHLSADDLAAIEAYVRAGGQVICFADFAAFGPAGGERTSAERQDSDLLLPVQRRRRTNVGVTVLRLLQDIAGAPHRAQVDIPIAPGEQSVYRADPREGAEVLAEYTDLRLPAAVAWSIGTGRLVWLNCHPGMPGDNLLADVMAYLGIIPMTSDRGGDLRAPTDQAEQDMRSQQRGRVAGYRGIILNPEAFPPSGFKADGSAYDLYFAGPDVIAVSLGYRHEELPSGSMVALRNADIGLHAYRTAMAMTDGQAAFTDGTGYVEWPAGGAIQRLVPARGDFETWIYEPGGSRLRAIGPGCFRAEQGLLHHALIDDGGAPVSRAVQTSAGSLELRVSRDAAIAVRLLADVLATDEVTVGRTSEGLGFPSEAPTELPVSHDRWFVDHAGVLHLDAEGGVLYEVGFGPRPEEQPLVPLGLTEFSGARYGTVDGQAAVWLERYAYETATVRFTHWDEAANGASLVLHGVTGDLYGAVLADVANPAARLRVSVNGREVSDAPTTTPVCVLDGDGGEWADLAIRIPKEALHRGLNVVRITNDGPNWFAFSAANVDFGAPR